MTVHPTDARLGAVEEHAPGPRRERPEYQQLIGPLRVIAREAGYALAVHGSLARDIDLVAIPWSPDACNPELLMESIRVEMERVTGHTCFVLNDKTRAPHDYSKGRRNPEPKPHGRLGWSIHIAGSGTYVDLSVTPREGRASLVFQSLQRLVYLLEQQQGLVDVETFMKHDYVVDAQATLRGDR